MASQVTMDTTYSSPWFAILNLWTTTISIEKMSLGSSGPANIIFEMACGQSRELWCLPTSTAFQIDHGISFDTLVNETPENILLIAHFDAFI
jgi:hypothetical protein